MILRNSKGLEKNFKIILEVEKNKTKYIVYQDEKSNNIYAGKLLKDEIKAINKDEYEFLSNILDKMKD